jgi:hypothetical protein
MSYPGNPYQDELRQVPPMDPLTDRTPPPQPQYPGQAPPATENIAQPAQLVAPLGSETGREEALTIKFAIGKLNDYLLWFLMVLEVTLLMQFILKLIGADPNNLFAGFLYALTYLPLFPFNEIVPNTNLGTKGAAIVWSTLIAMAVYGMVFYALRRFLHILISGPDEPLE